VKTTKRTCVCVFFTFVLLWTVIGSDVVWNIVYATSNEGFSSKKITDPFIQHIARSVVSCMPKNKTQQHDAMYRCIDIVLHARATSAHIAGAIALPASPWLIGVLQYLMDAVIVAGSGLTAAASAKIVLIVAVVVLITAFIVCMFMPGCIDNMKKNIGALYQTSILPTWSRVQQLVPALSSTVSWSQIRYQIDAQLHSLQRRFSSDPNDARKVVWNYVQEKTKEMRSEIEKLKKTLHAQGSTLRSKAETKQDQYCIPNKWKTISDVSTEQFILGKVDNRQSGLTVCVSAQAPNPLTLAQRVWNAYYNEVIPFLGKVTGLKVKNTITIYVTNKSIDGAFTLGKSDILLPLNMKWGASDTKNTPSTTIENPKNTAVLVHEMVHALIKQYDKYIEHAMDEGVATYVECTFLESKNYAPDACYPPNVTEPVPYIRRIIKKKDQPLFSDIGSMFQGGCIEKCIAYVYTEKFIRFLFDSLNKRSKKRPYAYIQEMFAHSNMDSWIWETAIERYLRTDWPQFIFTFEQHLCNSAKRAKIRCSKK
jgi:hypothetical protein